MHRDVDFLFDKFDVPFVINTVEYDPSRSGFTTAPRWEMRMLSPRKRP